MGLYRNRYLLALYDKDDFIIGVYDNVKELCDHLGCKSGSIRSAVCRQQRHVHLIDVLSVEDDEFAETDEYILQMYKSGQIAGQSVAEHADRVGCSARTLYRKMEVLRDGKRVGY